MIIQFVGQVPKDPSYPDAVEDSVELSPETGRIAVCDGASESFDSKTWAALLSARFVHCPEVSEAWIHDAVCEYSRRHDVSQMSWSKQAAFCRGSFSTLIGLKYTLGGDVLDLVSVGDSLAVLLDGELMVDSFPYARAEEFLQRPELISTNAALNDFIGGSDFSARHTRSWVLSERKRPTLLLMTDALGEWALRSAQRGSSVWQELAVIEDFDALKALVVRERSLKNMRTDDTTLIRISFAAADKNELPDTRTV